MQAELWERACSRCPSNESRASSLPHFNHPEPSQGIFSSVPTFISDSLFMTLRLAA